LRLRITDLPDVEEGDYGLVAVTDDHQWSTAWYDDDDYVCIACGPPRCGCELEDDSDESDSDDSDRLERWLICYPREAFAAMAAGIWGFYVHPSNARKLPDDISSGEIPMSDVGLVYAIAPTPELSLHRLKIGWTRDARTLDTRINSYRTSNPHAMILGVWEGDRTSEASAHLECDGRIGNSECFDTRDPFDALRRIGAAIAARTRL
jgi:hypothetical protein